MADDDTPSSEQTAKQTHDKADDKADEQPFDAVQAAAEFAAAMAEDPAAPGGDSSPAGGDKYIGLLEEEVESLKALLAERETALAAAQTRAATAVAEVDSARARIERSAGVQVEQKHRSVLASFLDVADALDRAVDQLGNSGVEPAVVQGVQVVRSELQSVLGRHGAKQRPSMGQPFDPAHHEAVATAPATAAAPDGTITAVVSEGYVLGEATLRVARVVVAKD